MRVTAFAMALMLGGAAIAQTSDPHAGHVLNPDGTVSASSGLQPGSASVDASVDVDPQTDTRATAAWDGQAMASNISGGQLVQPSNANPEEDARGIRVISHPAIVPAGYNGSMASAMGGPLLDPSTGEASAGAGYPACSATVTDNCVQTYERGRRG